MTPSGGSWQRQIQAADSAIRLLDELTVDQTRQIDVFRICEELDLWLSFEPLDPLLGAFVPEGAGGVLVTDRRPPAVQRYTAAHELGHWRLEHGHGLALDGEEHVFGTNPVERERLAQMFAANLLMPPPLVYSLLARLGLGNHGPVGPADAYFVAREAGVSFEAAVRQLANLQVVTQSNAAALLQVRPLAVKTQLAAGRRPVNGYADVWPVDEHWNGQTLALRPEDEVVVSLPENRSTGFRWMFDDEISPVEINPEPPIPPATAETSLPETVDKVLRAAKEARPGRAPNAALARSREVTPAGAHAPSHLQALPFGMSLVGDMYMPGRHLPHQENRPPRSAEARRMRLDVASGGISHTGGTERLALTESTAEGPIIAATGRRILGIRFDDPGPKTLRLQHCSPYIEASCNDEYILHAFVEPHRRHLSINQLADDPDEPWVGAVRERELHQLAS